MTLLSLLLIGTLLLSALLMDAAIRETLKIPNEHIYKGVWYVMFPLFLLVIIFTSVSIIVVEPQALLTDARNLSLVFFLFSSMMFGLTVSFTKRRALSC